MHWCIDDEVCVVYLFIWVCMNLFFRFWMDRWYSRAGRTMGVRRMRNGDRTAATAQQRSQYTCRGYRCNGAVIGGDPRMVLLFIRCIDALTVKIARAVVAF